MNIYKVDFKVSFSIGDIDGPDEDARLESVACAIMDNLHGIELPKVGTRRWEKVYDGVTKDANGIESGIVVYAVDGMLGLPDWGDVTEWFNCWMREWKENFSIALVGDKNVGSVNLASADGDVTIYGFSTKRSVKRKDERSKLAEALKIKGKREFVLEA